MYRSEQNIAIPNVDLCTWIFGNASYKKDKPIFVDATDCSQSISYQEAYRLVRRLIAGLRAKGLQPGDSVCVHSFNNIYYTVLLLAIIGAKGCFVGSNPAYTNCELSHLLTASRAKFIIVEPGLQNLAVLSASSCGIEFTNILLFNTSSENHAKSDLLSSWTTLLKYGEEDWYAFDNEKEAKTTTAVLACTSGTTGLPKVAMMPHYHFVSQGTQTADSSIKPYEVIRLVSIPPFHAFAYPLVHLQPLREGYTTYLMKRWNISAFLESIHRYRVTETAVVTPIVLALLALPEADVKHALRSLRMLWSGGSPLSAREQNGLCGLCNPEARFAQVWGLTEMGWITTFHFPEKDDSGSVGRLLPGNQAKIIDEHGNELDKSNARGRILIRGPSVMIGYLDNPEATTSMLINGWMHTGDIGYEDKGKWYITDREKDLIKVRGWQVSPTELEYVLLCHPRIKDAAVIGVDQNDGRGELPRAYIMMDNSGEHVEDKAIRQFMDQRLARFKALDGGIVRIDCIPKSASGKALKTVLRNTASKATTINGTHCIY